MKNRTKIYRSRNKSTKNSRGDSIKSYSTLESMRTDGNNRNKIADSLKFFVDNSESVKFITEPKDKYQVYHFSRQSLYNSIYHQDKFNTQKEKKKLNRSLHKYFVYDVLLDKNKDNQKSCNLTIIVKISILSSA